MRLTLDTARGCLLPSPVSSDALTRLYRTLGDAPLQLQIAGAQILPQLNDAGTLLAPGELQLIAREALGGDSIVSGSVQVSALPAADAPQLLSLGEDWKAAALAALFTTATQLSVTLQLQLRWRNGGEEWKHIAGLLETIVGNSLFVEDIVPGATVPNAEYLYLSLVDAYAGSATALESLHGALLPEDGLLKVVIGGSSSDWLVVKPASLATNLDAGVIRLLDGSAHLVRVGGL